jgi:hypothetical protein
MANENNDNEDLPKPILIKNLGMMYATKNSKERKRFGLYKCGFCGEEFRTQTSRVKNGYTKSCGCHKKRRIKEANTKHGLGYTRLYNIWKTMKDRTLNPKHKAYIRYGGRGITICEKWLDVRNFYDWAMSNGYEENKGLSIDRIDNDGNYEPNNCRWTTKTIQSRNRRISSKNMSGYKGVSFKKDKSKYKAYLTVEGKQVHIGYFITPVEGAIAYNNYIIENNLEGFILNEIPEEYQQCNLN